MLTQRRARSAGKSRPDDPLVGKVIHKRYRVVRKIASGGMATVYEAMDQRLQRTVALKVMHPGLGDPKEYAARFEREARAAAKLAHANVVGVHDFGQDRGTVYLAMELVPGRTTLRDLINAESPMPAPRALALLEPVIVALSAAHKAGIMHRDMKPENVLIAPNGAVKVADFGLARAITSTTQHTRTGTLLGTVSYVAPELVEHGISDARADVYAAGVILFEMLTGRKPHEGTNAIQVAYKHVNSDVDAPSRRVPTVPAIVDDLVAGMTARDPRFRPADATDLLEQIHRVQRALATGGPAAAAPASRLPAPTLAEPDPITDTASRGIPAVRLDASEPTGATDAPVRAPKPTRPTASIAVDTAKRVSHPIEIKPRRRRRWRGPIMLVLALLVAGGLGSGAWWFGYGRYDPVPGVLNLKQGPATTKLVDAGFEVEVTKAFTQSDSDKGLVIASDPPAGARMVPGTTITITISKGIEDYKLRDMSGWTLDRAQDYLVSIKMEYGTATKRWSETVPEGRVIRSDPQPGQWLRPGRVVDVWVSKGRKPINFADWTGRNADKAEQVLDDKGLTVRRSEQFSDSVAAGMVISMSPSSGPLYRGDSVSLLVSKGPELFEVPNVQGWGIDDARAKLEGDGFVVDEQKFWPHFGLGYVMDQDQVGEMLPAGSVITVYVS